MDTTNPYLTLAWTCLVVFSLMSTMLLVFTGDVRVLAVPALVCGIVGAGLGLIIYLGQRNRRYRIGDLRRRDDPRSEG